jgi:putative FmdB family regulatory protein
MPLFDYTCADCAERFEALVLPGIEARVVCASCGSADVERSALARFAVGGSDRMPMRASGGGCGTCGDPRGPGACRMDAD